MRCDGMRRDAKWRDVRSVLLFTTLFVFVSFFLSIFLCFYSSSFSFLVSLLILFCLSALLRFDFTSCIDGCLCEDTLPYIIQYYTGREHITIMAEYENFTELFQSSRFTRITPHLPTDALPDFRLSEFVELASEPTIPELNLF